MGRYSGPEKVQAEKAEIGKRFFGELIIGKRGLPIFEMENGLELFAEVLECFTIKFFTEGQHLNCQKQALPRQRSGCAGGGDEGGVTI